MNADVKAVKGRLPRRSHVTRRTQAAFTAPVGWMDPVTIKSPEGENPPRCSTKAGKDALGLILTPANYPTVISVKMCLLLFTR